jgi:hypothetical protein
LKNKLYSYLTIGILLSNPNSITECQVNPSDVIILVGILVFHDSRVRDLMNMKIFVDTGNSLPGKIISITSSILNLTINSQQILGHCLVHFDVMFTYLLL